ncbi:MAG: hypothetical protein RML84_09230 [Anaerolineae bacterium]|nr:hypothetical protein [Anaerolineae bacterium]
MGWVADWMIVAAVIACVLVVLVLTDQSIRTLRDRLMMLLLAVFSALGYGYLIVLFV